MEQNETKTIMILGAGQLQVPLLQRAKERGLQIVVVSPDRNQPGVPYADAVVELDVRDEEGILAAARAYKIDGITTDQTDLPVRTAAYVADAMGLSGIGYELGCLFTDKLKMRQKCDELDIPNQRYAAAFNPDEAVAKINKVGFPAIIKPIDSQASHGVTCVQSVDELKRFFSEASEYSRTGGVLIEQWIEGTEYSVDSCIVNGKCTVMAIGQYHPFSIEGVFSSYETIFPPNQPLDTIELIKVTNQKVVEGFDLKTGRTHAEYFVADGKCYLIEIAARGGGAFFSSDNVKFLSGISTEDFLLDFALGSKVEPVVNAEIKYGCCCTLFFYLPENGTVIGTEGIEQVLSYPFVHRNNLDQIAAKMKTRPIVDKAARYFMVVTADNHKQLQERIELIRSEMQIRTLMQNGDIKEPIWK